mmetsp:Transcript_12876/g.31573  ORF Transcript_12876/g.31573 Transcript_12876/m.31573 type:complete len:183 (-) Transcript_12876:388-936(-)
MRSSSSLSLLLPLAVASGILLVAAGFAASSGRSVGLGAALQTRGSVARAPSRFARQLPSGCQRRVIVRNEGLEQIPEPERANPVTGFTNRDSAGQSNIFATETRAYVGEQVSDNGLVTGGYFLAAAAAAGAFLVPQLAYKEDFSTPKYSTIVEFENKFSKELGMQSTLSAPSVDAAPAVSSE